MAENVRGCLLKEVDAFDLATCIRAAAAGENVTAVVPPAAPAATGHRNLLTARELDVLRAVAAGDTNRQIAQGLGLAENTVKAYLRSVLQKLGSRNRLEAVMQAQQQGLL